MNKKIMNKKSLIIAEIALVGVTAKEYSKVRNTAKL